MKFDKPRGGSAVDGPVDGRFPDGTTEAQRANCRAIYEDPSAYAAWRKKMSLDVEREDKPDLAMRDRVESKLSGLSASLAFPREKRRKDYRPIEETLAEYAAKPLTISEEFAEHLREGAF